MRRSLKDVKFGIMIQGTESKNSVDVLFATENACVTSKF